MVKPLVGTDFLPPLGLAPLVGFGPPVLYAISQWAAYKDWKKRVAFLPALVGVGMGVALNNTWAVLGALFNVPADFARTPKFGLKTRADRWQGSDYALGHWSQVKRRVNLSRATTPEGYGKIET